MIKVRPSRILVEITGDDYQTCDDNAHNMWCHEKRGEYGPGLLNSEDDTHRTERVGQLGECAFAAWMGVPYRWEYKQGGDNGDFDFPCRMNEKDGVVKIDVKTAGRDYGSCLIYKTSPGGVEQPLKCHAYVCAVIRSDDRETKTATVELLGFVTRTDVKENAIVEQTHKQVNGSQGRWMNYRVDHDTLRPMEELRERLTAVGWSIGDGGVGDETCGTEGS